MFLVVAKVQARSKKLDDLLSDLNEYIERVLREEPGTLFFDVYRDARADEDQSVNLVILEGYHDEAAYAVHVAMPYRDAAIKQIRTHLIDGSAEQFTSVENTP